MHWIDWSIVAALIVFVTITSLVAKRYTRSVADFLAANRCAGRYVISVSDGIAAVGAITFVAWFEMNYVAGFVPSWWIMVNLPLMLVLSLSGWVVYRFRQTRALTMAQFFELRYSKRFRIFAGLVAFGSGIVNFGIFPGIGARFFIRFCALPDTFACAGLEISTFAAVMFILLSVALFFTFIGGQIAVIITDFFQGMFCNIMFVLIVAVLLYKVDWNTIVEALTARPEGESMLNPFQTGNVKGFDFWYYLIALVGLVYNFMGWQGTQAYNASARSAHEARMAKTLGVLRTGVAQHIMVVFIPICAYTVMHHADFSHLAAQAHDILSGISNEKIRLQMTSPVALGTLLPVGMVGGFCAVMAAAFISTHDTCLHSWGSILIQDVVLPFRKTPLTPKQHMLLLRLAIAAVAIFAYVFSLLFRQTQHIQMYFAVTGAIFLGGSGAVIIGGLYWKRGTTAAAWSSMIVGSVLAVAGVIIKQCLPDFPIDGQRMYLIAIIAALATYVLVSLLGPRTAFNMDRLLHRGQYASADAAPSPSNARALGKWSKRLGITGEFTRWDKIIYFAVLAWAVAWLLVYAVGTTYNLFYDVSEIAWSRFWRFYLLFSFAAGVFITIWLMIGGLIDLKKLFADLNSARRNDRDDGTVVDHRNADE